jgi:hypothetical protein
MIRPLWPWIQNSWAQLKPILWFLCSYIFALMIVSSGDLTSYSANYLWKNLLIFGCLVIAVTLHAPLLQPLKWSRFSLSAPVTTSLVIHLMYVPLMLLCSRREQFSQALIPLSLVFSLIPFFGSTLQQVIRRKSKWVEEAGSSLSLKDYALSTLKGKKILLSSPCPKVLAQYAHWLALTAPQEVIFLSTSDLALLEIQLKHDFPEIQWLFSKTLDFSEDTKIDLVIDGSLCFDSPDEIDRTTLTRIHHLQHLLQLEPTALLMLHQVRPEDNQVNSLVEDYLRHADHKSGRSISLRHYPIAESPLTHAWLVSHLSNPQKIRLQHLDDIVVHSLNLACQLITNSQHIGEAWALTEVVTANLSPSFLTKPARFKDKMNAIERLLHHPQQQQYHLSPSTAETNEPHLAIITQPALNKKKLALILNKVEEKLQKERDQEAA